MGIFKRSRYIALAFIVLASFTAVFFVLGSRASNTANHISDERHSLSVALYDLSVSAESETRLMRVIAVNENTEMQRNAFDILIDEDRASQVIEIFMEWDAPQREIELLEEFARRRNLMNEIFQVVFYLRDEGRLEDAIDLAHSREIAYLGTPLGPKIDELLQMVYHRTAQELEDTEIQSRFFMSLSLVFSIGLVLIGAIGLFGLLSVVLPMRVRVVMYVVLLTPVINLVFVAQATNYANEMHQVRKDHYSLIAAVYDLERSTEALTRLSRIFVITQGEAQFALYQAERGRDVFGRSLDTFVLSQATDQETNTMVYLVNRVTNLRVIEDRVMQERTKGLDREVAIERVFGPSFVQMGFPVNGLCVELRGMIDARVEETLHMYSASYRIYHNLVLGSSAFLFLVGAIGTIVKTHRKTLRTEVAPSDIILKFRYANIKTSLLFSFGAIILLFSGQIVATTFFNNNIRSLNNHNMEFIMARSELLLEFHQEFTEMRLILAESFMDSAFLETADEALWSSYERRLTHSYENLNRLSEAYLQSIQDDPVFPKVENDTRVYIMITIMNYVKGTYYAFSENFFLDGDRSLYFEHDMGYTESAVIMMDALRRIRNLNQEIITDNMRHYTFISQSITNGSLVVAVLLASSAAWFVIRRFVNKMSMVQNNAEAVIYGDFGRIVQMDESDEISKLFKEIVGALANVVNQVNYVVEQHSVGDDQIRIDVTSLKGSSLEMAMAINKLLDTVTENLIAIRSAEERSNIMLNGNPAACFLIDEDFRVIDCNEAATALLKFENKQETLLRSHEIFAARGFATLERIFLSALASGHESFEWELSNARGGFIPAHITFARFASRDKKVIAAYIQDLTAIRNMLEQQELMEIAQENSQAKSRFLARMSHELRTPLTAVMGISEIQMHNKALSPDAYEAFTKINNSADVLLGIVNDILDLSKIEAGKMDITNIEYDSASMFSDVAQLNLVYLGSKRLDFVVDVGEDVPSLLKGDELRIKQVVNNVLSNAFKYTDKGSVNLRVRVENSDLDNIVNLVITVTDTGKGMSEQQLKALFDDYSRFHTRNDAFDVGTGLGMSITRGLLTRMDGTIAVTSSVGKGTEVTIILPQTIVTSQTLGKAATKSLKSFSTSAASTAKRMSFKPEPMPYGRVLVVDDVDANIYVANGLLELYELEIETCSSGVCAVQKIEDGQVYDIIFMDQMMPEMTGTEAAAAIRGMGYTNPIVALTANALVGQADEFMRSGFDGFLSKPIQTAQLNAVLHKFIKEKHFPSVDGVGFVKTDASDVEEIFDNHMPLEIIDKINQDFLSTQGDVINQISYAQSQGDNFTAERLAHTLKGLASLIEEEALANVAAEAETRFKEGGEPGDVLDRLASQLDPVLDRLKAQYSETDNAAEAAEQWTKTLDKAVAIDVFGRLEELLKRRSFDASDMVVELTEIPDTKELIEAVKTLEFRHALKILKDLRETLGLHDK
ncbi:MAG: ATP-binding protein [Defluviitaleaceae bacterium]|nr:ATP-binding protein [Defluviitaleaceae bacterium]